MYKTFAIRAIRGLQLLLMHRAVGRPKLLLMCRFGKGRVSDSAERVQDICHTSALVVAFAGGVDRPELWLLCRAGMGLVSDTRRRVRDFCTTCDQESVVVADVHYS